MASASEEEHGAAGGERWDVAIVMPVFDDWEAVALLLPRLDKVLSAMERRAALVIVSDSPIGPSAASPDISGLSRIGICEVVTLSRNMGHQKAIAVGLSHVWRSVPCRAVCTLDADGEDRPEDLEKLLAAAGESPSTVVFAERTRRSEGPVFKAFYRAYKTLFRALTGNSISFGNFCVVPWELLETVLSISEIWVHFSAGVMRARVPYIAVPTERGRRLVGGSHMNMVSLILHGLSAISVFIDTVAVRLIVCSLLLAVGTVAGIIVVVALRVFTDLAIPGWATYATLGLLIVFLQAVSLSVVMAFLILAHGSQKRFLPKTDCEDYVLEVRASGDVA